MFEPEPVRVIDSPRQIKAFTDSLRIRVLIHLVERAATNQQIADALGEPHAKVLYHVRFLQDAGLIQLIDTRIKGGNVEKYYRAVARRFDFQPSPELRPAVVSAELDSLYQEASASSAAWPDHPVQVTLKGWHMSKQQAEDLFERIAEYIVESGRAAEKEESSEGASPDDAGSPLHFFGLVMYRNPRAPEDATEG
jgi:DNA-binding transcriptional ArsR family regulator